MAVSKPSMVKVDTPLSKWVTSGKRSKTTKIAWHFTGKADCLGKNTVYNWFLPIAQGKHPSSYASAHFVMDLDGTIYQMIPMNYVAYTTNSANSYSIGIECATTGSDDHYSDAEYKSMVKLGAWLAQYYGLDPRNDFIRHYDVTKKVCPRYFVNNSAKWKQFKLDCYNYMKGNLKASNIRNCTNGKGNSILNSEEKKEEKKEETFKKYIARATTNNLNCRKGAGTSYDVIQQIDKGAVFTVVAESGNWVKSASGYWVSKSYIEFVRYA